MGSTNMFEGIKVGDEVMLHTWTGSFNYIHRYDIRKVTKVAKTIFEIEGCNLRFRIDNGRVYGGNYKYDTKNVVAYNKGLYEESLAEEKKCKRKHELLDRIKQVYFNGLSLEVLEEICEVLDKSK